MGYQDFFGESFTPTHQSETVTTPLDSPTFDTSPVVEKYDVMSFQGFSSGKPLLLERPTVYVNRILNSARQLVALPADDQHDGIEGRAYLSSIFTLPAVLLYEGDMIANETVNQYPYLHFPSNQTWNPDKMGLDEYLLAIEYMFTVNDIAQETTDGDLLTYGLDGDYTIDEDAWQSACEWVNEIKEPLTNLNRGRLLGFAMRSGSEEELRTLGNLFDMWGEERDPNQIISDAQASADDVEDLYAMLFDIPFDAFH